MPLATPSTVRVLDPRVLAATRGLQLAARQLVSGLLSGLHTSRQPGLAREFSQYRAYQPGDDPRHLDWKLFARSDRLFLRESEIETAVSVRLVLDATASMQHADTTGAGAGVRKFDLARTLAAALAYLAQAQGDPAGLHAVVNGSVVSVPPGRTRQPFARIVHALERLEPAGAWPLGGRRVLESAFADRGSGGANTPRELIVILSDSHERGDEIRAALAPLRARRHELLFLHLLGRDERSFPFRGPVRFEDWETGEAVETDAASARAAWLADLERCRAEWMRAGVEAPGRFHYGLFTTDEPPDLALRAYLRQRLRGIAGGR